MCTNMVILMSWYAEYLPMNYIVHNHVTQMTLIVYTYAERLSYPLQTDVVRRWWNKVFLDTMEKDTNPKTWSSACNPFVCIQYLEWSNLTLCPSLVKAIHSPHLQSSQVIRNRNSDSLHLSQTSQNDWYRPFLNVLFPIHAWTLVFNWESSSYWQYDFLFLHLEEGL